MYGMIHKAVRDMVEAKFGEEAWIKIAADAGVTEEHLLSMNTYEDKVIYDMVESATKMLGVTPVQVLERFGQYFVIETLQNNYKSLLQTYGRSSFVLLENLNTLHTTIKATFPGYKPPSFTVTYITEDEIDVLYESERVGLTPFVRGLIAGTAEFYGETISITQEEDIPVTNGESARFRLVRE